MKRILIIIILCLSLSLCACTKETIQLEKYITNADQVYTILYQYFNTTELTITESDYNEECGTEQYFFYVLKAFLNMVLYSYKISRKGI